MEREGERQRERVTYVYRKREGSLIGRRYSEIKYRERENERKR